MSEDRIHIDIGKLRRSASSLKCFTCGTPLSQIDSRQHACIWYCSKCDVFHEATEAGAKLRSFRKGASQIINLGGEDDEYNRS